MHHGFFILTSIQNLLSRSTLPTTSAWWSSPLPWWSQRWSALQTCPPLLRCQHHPNCPTTCITLWILSTSSTTKIWINLRLPSLPLLGGSWGRHPALTGWLGNDSQSWRGQTGLVKFEDIATTCFFVTFTFWAPTHHPNNILPRCLLLTFTFTFEAPTNNHHYPAFGATSHFAFTFTFKAPTNRSASNFIFHSLSLLLSRLQRTDLPAISDVACKASYSDSHYWEWLKEDMICAGDLVLLFNPISNSI